MLREVVSTIFLTLLVVGAFPFSFRISPVEANGTIFIRADGKVDPSTARISTVDYVTYTLTDNIHDSIVVEKDYITIDGAAHLLQGAGAGVGLSLSGRTNVVVKNLNISNFDVGLSLQNSSDNQILYNTLTENTHGILFASYSTWNYMHDNNIVSDYFGIELSYSDNNVIYWNNITANRQYGMYVDNSSNNFICQNNFMNNSKQVYTHKSVNIWNDDWPPYGNYWSDYTGVDEWALGDYGYNDVPRSDGIGETAYIIDSSDSTTPVAMDIYPLMKPFWLVAEPTKSVSPAYYETSEYLIGKVAVGVIFPESNGTIDPSTEDWNTTEESMVISKVETALNFLENLGPAAHLSFQMDIHYGLPTSFEPVSRTYGDFQWWMDDTMHDLGYSSVLDYVNDLRTKLNADWASIIFIVNSQNTTNGCFRDSWSDAGAAMGGPWVVATTRYLYSQSSDPFPMDRVIAHEFLHTFYATDEYDGGLTGYSGYLNVTSELHSDCLMGEQVWKLCNATREQIGWRDSNGNGIPDIIDTFPEIEMNPFDPNQTSHGTLTCTGCTAEVPYPNHNPYVASFPKSHFGRRSTYFPIRRTERDMTINKIVNVQYRVDDGTWVNATPTDGDFDEAQENFTFTIPTLGEGNHVIEVRGMNSVGNTQIALMTGMLPTAKLQYGPDKPTATETITFKATSDYVSGVNIPAYEWDFGDGNATTVTQQAVSHAYMLPGNYTVTLKVWVNNTLQNTTSKTLAIYFATDLNKDGTINILDMTMVAIAFGSKPGDPNWNQTADLNRDGVIDIVDITMVAIDFGKTV